MQEKPSVRIGIAGLGIGTLASYGRPGDTIRFYEINPAVTDIFHLAAIVNDPV